MTLLPLRRPGRAEPTREVAAAWALKQEQGLLGDGARQRFADWLAESQAHVDAYEDALWALRAVAHHAAEPELMTLRGAALAARGKRRQVWGRIGAGGVAAAVLAGVALWHGGSGDGALPVGTAVAVVGHAVDDKAASYLTGIGERSTIQLPDGSVATLDTDSQLRLAYTDRERGVVLLRGQALFEVAHGRPTPFQVYARGQRITAVGTVFNVRIQGDQVRVAMVEGTVKVRSAATPGGVASPAKDLTLTAGEALVAAPARPTTVAAIDPQQAASWKGGLLVFDDTPLAGAVAEINRYTTRPIAIADASIGDLRVTGVFRSNDPEHFSDAVAEVLPVVVTHSPEGAPTLRGRRD